jgi:hypothetical protein
MKKNVGGTDRIARIVGGGAMLGAMALPMFRSRTRAAMALGALASGISGYCPVNAAMGINSRRRGMLGFLGF